MRRVLFAVAGLVLIGAAPASAQYVPRPVIPIGPMAVEDVADIVQAMGLDPVGQPMRSGPFFVQRARDDFGRVLQVTVDARRSQVMAIEAVGAPRRPYGIYAGYGPYRRYHPGYAGLPDDADLTPPRSVMAPHGQPPQAQPPHAAAPPPHAVAPPKAQSQRPVKSAAVPPSRPPVPRKRPAAAPEQASAGSVEPVAPASQAAPAQSAPPAAEPAPPAAVAPAAPTNPAVTPVTPLE